MRKLGSATAKLEGKKSQTSIGNVRETLKSMIVVLAEEKATKASADQVLNLEYDTAFSKAVAKAVKKAAKAQK